MFKVKSNLKHEKIIDSYSIKWLIVNNCKRYKLSIEDEILYVINFIGAQAFSRKHPLSCWLSTMLVIFSGAMVANGLLGEPILAPLKNTPQLIVGTLTWYVLMK